MISQAAEEICRLIGAQKLEPGQRLPTEQRLSSMLGISRNSLREALRILDGLGFVEKRPGRGIVVRTPLGGGDAATAEDAAAVAAAPVAFEIRMIVERRCAELAAEVGTEAEFEELGGHLRLFEEALKRGDLVAAMQAHLSFHDALVATAKNRFLSSIFQGVRFVIAEVGRRGARRTYRNPRQFESHREICAALRMRDARRVAAAVTEHFEAVGPLIEFMAKNPPAIDAGDGR